MKVSALKVDLKIEESEREIWIDLKLQHAWNIVKLQEVNGIQYKEDHNFMSFQTLALVSEDKSALGKAYISKRLISFILMICQDV